MAENPNYQMGISHSANEFAKWKKIRIKAGMKSKPYHKSVYSQFLFGAPSPAIHCKSSVALLLPGFSLLSGALNR